MLQADRLPGCCVIKAGFGELLIALREPLTPLSSAAQEPYRPDAKTLQHQEELRLIFKRQQEKGGIIDPEAERNRYFISLQAVGHRGQGSAEVQGQAAPASGPSSPFSEISASFFQPPATADPGQAAAASELVSASAVDAPQAPCQTSAPEPARAAPAQPERPAVPGEPQSRRERHRGERPGPKGPGRQTCSGSQEAAEEACQQLHGSRAPRGFSRRPERRPGGRHSQEAPKHPSRSRAAALAERKELCPEDPSPETEAADLKEERRDAERWTPEQGAETQGGEKENLAFSCSDHRWQGHHRPWDCGRWERSRAQERGSYPRAPRGRGALRPSGRQEAQLLEKESGS